ncbi:hypothetical protein UFOVP49_127 [uncultured Caudovirales phage]|uniref:Uncharacterized protein n=1 Tax=uncultured Caudovirales phage TaxID=2100421 RepID=A0A6J5KWD9_9CAUD|nr:hypothetical protein UFOVP49_127 [uncultured Caudovirales phage]
MEKKHVLQTIKHIMQHKRDERLNLKFKDRQFPDSPHITQPQTTKPSMSEEGEAAPASGMSIGADPVPSLKDPNVGHAFKKLRQKLNSKTNNPKSR